MRDRNNITLAQRVNRVEEAFIAIVLGLMTLVTFSNVIARYVFNDNLLWALEITLFLFAWLVLLGASYCVKKDLHLGIDLVINVLPRHWRRLASCVGVALCLTFSLLLLKGSWDYWYPFVTTRAFLETEDVPMPEFLQFLAEWLNEGDRYENLPRFIPYFSLPLGAALLTLRFLQLAWRIGTGQTDRLMFRNQTGDRDEVS